MQSSSMSQRSCTDNSSHCVASASEAQMFSSSWLKESMACPAEVAAHYMLANTCFYSCFASSSISLHPQSYSIEKSISIKLVGSQPLTVKLSGSHMVVARDEEGTRTWWSCWLLLKPFEKWKDTENETMTYNRRGRLNPRHSFLLQIGLISLLKCLLGQISVSNFFWWYAVYC